MRTHAFARTICAFCVSSGFRRDSARASSTPRVLPPRSATRGLADSLARAGARGTVEAARRAARRRGLTRVCEPGMLDRPLRMAGALRRARDRGGARRSRPTRCCGWRRWRPDRGGRRAPARTPAPVERRIRSPRAAAAGPDDAAWLPAPPPAGQLRVLLFLGGPAGGARRAPSRRGRFRATPTIRPSRVADRFLAEGPAPELPVSGSVLIARGVEEGPRVGEVLRIFRLLVDRGQASPAISRRSNGWWRPRSPMQNRFPAGRRLRTNPRVDHSVA